MQTTNGKSSAMNGSSNAKVQNADAQNAMNQAERYRVSVEQYLTFLSTGFLVVPQLVSPDEIQELRGHTDDLMQGRLPQQNQTMAQRDLNSDTGTSGQSLEAPPAHLSPEEKAQFFLRIHMLHRQLELHERFMLHPRVLDVLESLIGPDVLALQTMLFLKPPGKPGQGWHQDAFYIPTIPDTVIGAWIAIDDSDEQNGAMWFAQGSQIEPIYPPRGDGVYGFGQRDLDNIAHVGGVSDPDDEKNDLSRVAGKYPQVLCSAKAGDVVFFGSHVLHRSKKNWSPDRTRRSFVSHYCNARSWTQWGGAALSKDPHAAPTIDAATGMTNGSHILARGNTHLPFARPRFGTTCAALLSEEERQSQSAFAAASMADMDSGMMASMPTDPDAEHDHSGETGVM